jgi:hypothetical protein
VLAERKRGIRLGKIFNGLFAGKEITIIRYQIRTVLLLWCQAEIYLWVNCILAKKLVYVHAHESSIEGICDTTPVVGFRN